MSKSKVINITDKLSDEKPVIVAGEKEYEVNASMETVLKFEELAAESTAESFKSAFNIALGEEATKELKLTKMSLANMKVWMIAIMAAMQGMEYEEAEARFRKSF